MDTQEFRRLGHEMVEWIALYRERMADLPVMSPLGPGEVRRRLPGQPPMPAAGFAWAWSHWLGATARGPAVRRSA